MWLFCGILLLIFTGSTPRRQLRTRDIIKNELSDEASF